MAVTIDTSSEEEVKSGVLGRRLREFNYTHVEHYPETAPVWLGAQQDDGRLVGGLRGYVFMQWLHVDVLWVDEDLRGQGIGARLMDEAEAHARALGATRAKLETFEWQASAFYRKRGYTEYARIERFVGDAWLAYLMKTL